MAPAVAIQNDGEILVARLSDVRKENEGSGQYDFGSARYNGDGSLDTGI